MVNGGRKEMRFRWLKFLSLVFLLRSRSVTIGSNMTGESAESQVSDSLYNGTKLNQILQNYDRKIRPNTYGPAINVQVEVKVVSFGPVEESQQHYEIDMFFRQWWTDPRIKGAVNQSLTMAIDVGTLIWKPDTYFVNARDPAFQFVTKETMRVIIKPDGSVYYSARINLKANCPMEFDLYPMDTQICPLYIESYSYTTEEVIYTWHESAGKLRKTKGVEWIATNGPIYRLVNVTSKQSDINNNSKGAFSKLKIMFHLARNQGYYLWHVYLPGALLVMMTWVNFWLPASAYPARVTVCVTSFLSTMLVMSASSNTIARVSYVKALDYFLMGNATFVFLALVEYVIVLHSSRKIPFKFWQKKKGKKLHDGVSFSKENKAYVIDKYSSEARNGTEVLAFDEKGIRRRDISDSISNFNYEFSGKKDLRKSDNNSPFVSIPNELDNQRCRACKTCQERDIFWYEKVGKSHELDVLSRIVFPILYVIFVVGYVLYYKYK